MSYRTKEEILRQMEKDVISDMERMIALGARIKRKIKEIKRRRES